MIRAIVFDFDGVLLDTEPVVLRSWRELYAAHGHELPLDRWLTTVGTRDAPWDPETHLATLLGEGVDPAQLAARRTRELAYADELPLMPGVAEYLRDARDAGLRVGLASSSSWKWVGRQLEQRGLVDAFDAVVTRWDVEASKPHPAPYIETLARLSVPAEDAVAVEDSAHGVASAKAAGMRVLALPHGLTAAMRPDGADVVAGSLDALPLPELLALLS